MGECAPGGHNQAGKHVRAVHRQRAVCNGDVRPVVIRVVGTDGRVAGKGRCECREADQD